MKKYIIANWKMYLGYHESLRHAQALVNVGVASSRTHEVVVCPTYIALGAVHELLPNLSLGAQDCSFETTGAHTGQTSPHALKELGCTYVILGHSERRQQLGETDGIIKAKLRAALEAQLTPVVCIGETLKEKQAGQGKQRIVQQITTLLSGLSISDTTMIIIAYEPIWAIYPSSFVVEPSYVSDMIAHIAQTVSSVIDAHHIRLIYGGSVNKDNATTYISLPGVHGVLPGHASTDAHGFSALINNS